MNADEFISQVRPGIKRSKLEPYLADLIKLKEAGYTLEQLKTFLSKNNVSISIATISAYLKRKTAPSAVKKNQKEGDQKEPDNKKMEEEEDLSGLTPKQRREKIADKYMSKPLISPFVQSILDKQNKTK